MTVHKAIWIGVDIGTTGVRAVAFHADGTALAASSDFYPLHTPQPSWAQQDAAEICAATDRVMRDVGRWLGANGKAPAGVALSTVMHGFIALDASRCPLTEMMTWGDGRSSEIVGEIRGDAGLARSFYEKTCCPVHAAYPLAKIGWLRRNQPETFAKMRYVGMLKDTVFEGFTGEWAIDRSTATVSGIYNAHTLEWDADILRFLQIDAAALPEVVPTTYRRPLTRAAAERLNLPAGIPVVIGATDGVLVNVGIGAVANGQISATVGTSGALRMLTKKPRIDEKGRTWCYNLTEDLWVAGGAINNGGIALRWVRDELCRYDEAQMKPFGIDPYGMMTLQAGQVAAGADGLIMMPFFMGERSPYWNSDLRAAYFGLSLNHGRAHMIRAAMEGVCYSLQSVMQALRGFGNIKDIRVSGSFTKSPVWLQILADVLGEEIKVPAIGEGAAFGAAVLGFISDGEMAGISDVAKISKVNRVYLPEENSTVAYRKLYAIYENLYRSLEPNFKAIVDYQNGLHK